MGPVAGRFSSELEGKSLSSANCPQSLWSLQSAVQREPVMKTDKESSTLWKSGWTGLREFRHKNVWIIGKWIFDSYLWIFNTYCELSTQTHEYSIGTVYYCQNKFMNIQQSCDYSKLFKVKHILWMVNTTSWIFNKPVTIQYFIMNIHHILWIFYTNSWN